MRLTSRLAFQPSKLRDVLRLCGSRSFCDNPQLRLSDRTAMPSFGVLLDIDGVLVRGRKSIPGAKEALEMLRQAEVPSVFLTNGGCESEKEAAERLSDKIGFEIKAEQMVLSHTPLRMFDWLYNKHVLISGQQNIKEIVQDYGFTKVSDIEDVRRAYPLLDMVDRERRFNYVNLGIPPEKLPPIEAILLLGEPVRWETNLQLVIDLLVTSGSPASNISTTHNEQIPVIAVNTDLIYMSEAPLPRFGHGAFLLCLEALYKKLTGRELIYTDLLGKPNMTSYQYAEYCLLHQISGSKPGQIKSLYAVGDNLDTDIYGANMVNEYLKSFHKTNEGSAETQVSSTFKQIKNTAVKWLPEVKSVESILVHTGVSSQNGDNPTNNEKEGFQHRDTVFRPYLRRPSHVVDDITEAVELILREEQESS